MDKPCRTEHGLSKLWLSTCIDKRPVGGPQAQDETHLYTTGRTPGDEGLWGYDPSGLKGSGAHLQDHAVQGVRRDRTAGMPEADVSDFREAFRENVLEEPAEKLQGVERGGPWSSAARLAVGESDGAVCESHEAAVGDGDPEDRGGEVLEGRVAMRPRLRVDVPGEVPDVWGDVLQQSGLAHVFFEEGSVEGRESFHGDKAGGSGGSPGGAILRESTARDNGMDVGMVLELPAPGMQDAGETRKVSADEPLVFGEAFEGERRGGEQGVVGEAVMRADKGAEGLRDGKGDEAVWPWELFVEVVREPLLGFMLLALWAVAVATGMIDAVFCSAALALIEAMAIVSATAMADGVDDLAVRGGQLRIARQVLWGKGVEDVTQGGHGKRLLRERVEARVGIFVTRVGKV